MYGKLLIIAAFCAVQCLLGVQSMGLLGKEMCTKGQVYWCNNLRNAKSCNAVKHCIQSVWERQTLPEDNGDICNICKDMVTQARAQLESNETQEELKEVFEGSCKLIPVKIVTQECIKMVDEFIPELVETLASQMNPQMVCSVAGLCNSARNDQLLAEYKAKLAVSKNNDDCNGCRVVVATMKDRFQGMTRDQFMEELLELCGKTGSLSDGCSSLVVAHLNTIYNHLSNNLHPQAVCDLAGVCHANYHQHKKPEVQIINESSTGTLSHGLEAGEDVPCELCEQLVIHLRDVLVTNTTEDEFKLVLEGLCKQTGSFKSECLGLVDNYFDGLFKFLTSELNPTTACQAIHICNGAKRPKVSLTPLLPADQVVPTEEELGHVPLSKVYTGGWKEEGLKKPNLIRVKLEKDLHKALPAPETAQLPIERTMPQTVLTLGNKPVCELCEYFLHYLQQALTTPATEEKIREIVDHGCEKLPGSISESCVDFVNTYGDALVSLLAQEIDPSQVCPSLGVCPGMQLLTRPFVNIGDKPTCPLCLMAIEQLDKVLTDNKTEENIRDALEAVCKSMPNRLVSECDSLVDQYTEEMVDMLIADFTPQEVCVYLKLCTGGSKIVPTNPKADFEIMTNEIPDYKVTHMEEASVVIPSHVAKKGNWKKAKDSSTCVICEFIMSQIDNALKDNATDEEIKHTVRTVCNYLPKTVAKECNGFVDRYADAVISLLAEFMDPKDVCSALKLCHAKHLDKAVGPATVNLLGGKKCTWGPSYWCQSEIHANACKATKHCQDKVWNGLKPASK